LLQVKWKIVCPSKRDNKRKVRPDKRTSERGRVPWLTSNESTSKGLFIAGRNREENVRRDSPVGGYEASKLKTRKSFRLVRGREKEGKRGKKKKRHGEGGKRCKKRRKWGANANAAPPGGSRRSDIWIRKRRRISGRNVEKERRESLKRSVSKLGGEREGPARS